MRGTFTADMVVASPITVPMVLGAGEMARISRKMDEIGFFSYPAVLTVPRAERGGQMTPFASYRLAIKTEAGTKVVAWDDAFGSDDERALGLQGLARLIESIIVARPDYRRLPEPQGGYLEGAGSPESTQAAADPRLLLPAPSSAMLAASAFGTRLPILSDEGISRTLADGAARRPC